jgi:pyrroline-5-carboxylate reductase
MSMSNEITVGFIGFGEAGSNIAKGLKSAGIKRIFAYDIDPDRVRSNATETETPLLVSNRELADAAQVLFSTVTCARAKEAAKQTAPRSLKRIISTPTSTPFHPISRNRSTTLSPLLGQVLLKRPSCRPFLCMAIERRCSSAAWPHRHLRI